MERREHPFAYFVIDSVPKDQCLANAQRQLQGLTGEIYVIPSQSQTVEANYHVEEFRCSNARCPDFSRSWPDTAGVGLLAWMRYSAQHCRSLALRSLSRTLQSFGTRRAEGQCRTMLLQHMSAESAIICDTVHAVSCNKVLGMHGSYLDHHKD